MVLLKSKILKLFKFKYFDILKSFMNPNEISLKRKFFLQQMEMFAKMYNDTYKDEYWKIKKKNFLRFSL